MIGELEVTDIFCGAGGSSLGLEFVPGMRVTQALNHWDLAVEAHNANFPNADHDVHDIEEIPASRFRRTPVLWASPECVHHAYCRSKHDDADEAQRSRATFNDIVRFTAFHRYDAVIVENVVEARLWCDTRGHPKKCNCGSHFDGWREEMHRLGYESRIVFFNSQFALPTPQSRDRMYVVFWRRGLRAPNLDFTPASWCSSCAAVVAGVQTWKPASRGSVRDQPGKFEWGRYGAQYLYICPGCSEPVAPAVVGARTIIDWSIEAQRIGDRAKPLADKTRARIKTGLERLATLDPVVVQVGGHLYERPGYARVWSVDDPMRAVTGTSCMGLVVRAGGQGGNGRSLDEPIQTVIGSDRQVALVVPNREHAVGGGLEEPLRGVTTAPAQHMLVALRHGSVPANAGEPLNTLTTRAALALVSMRNHGDVRPVDLPGVAVCSGGYHHGLLVYNGVPGFVRSLEDAAGTVTGRDKQSLLVPYYGTGVGHDTAEPMGAVTGKDRHGLVVSDEEIDACLFRMLQWPELLRAQQMHEHLDGRPYELSARRRDKRGRVRELSNEQRVKMIGNAVSSPVAAMLGGAVAEALAA